MVPSQYLQIGNATDGATRIVNKPSLALVATSGQWSDLVGKPVLASVASTGNYADLTGKPSSINYSSVTNTPRLSAIAITGSANNLSAGSLTIDLIPTGSHSIGSVSNIWQNAFLGNTSTTSLTSGNAAFSGSLLQTATQSHCQFCLASICKQQSTSLKTTVSKQLADCRNNKFKGCDQHRQHHTKWRQCVDSRRDNFRKRCCSAGQHNSSCDNKPAI